MNIILENIFKTKKFTNSKNEIIDIHSETPKGQCEFISQIIKENNFKRSLEIGFAYGISTLVITDEIVKNGGSHLVIDKFQNTDWGGNGLDIIKQAGLSNKVEFKEDFCYKVLPKLLEKERTFDFAYVDSTKQFDWLMLDFFFIDKLLEVNGVVVFDDVSFPGIRKLFRYITQFPNYNLYGQYPENSPLKGIRNITKILKILPKSEKWLKDEIILTDYELGINSNCVALIKTGDDKRNWDWHVEF